MRRAVAALLVWWLAMPLAAQPLALATDSSEPVTLIADSLEITDERRLVAQGNVEIFQGITRLRASRVIYDGTADTLLIEGPIELREGETTIIVAQQAELSRGLQNGILTGARLVLEQQMQVSAAEMERVGGRYTQAWKVAATSCNVCDSGRPPIWQIRAKRIVHDQEEQQLYFDEAQLRVLGVPVFYIPRLRLPDPSLERATGFLVPQFRSSSLLGSGALVPYFIALGDHSDLTISPFLTTRTRTLELTYRHAFAAGDIEANVFLSDDDFGADDTRWGVLADGAFALPRSYELNFDIEASSDRAYFSDYDYSDKDRLDSALTLSRTRPQDTTRAEIVAIRSLRDDEANDTIPSVLFDAHHAWRFTPADLGGLGLAKIDFHSHYRSSNSTTDADGDGLADGIDVTRAGFSVDWARQWPLENGMVLGSQALAATDAYFISDDPQFESTLTRTNSGAGVNVSWPLMARASNGAMHFLEPKVQLAYTTASHVNLPNEDSTRVEFDDGNLFSLNRAPGVDVIEDGARIDAGVTWRRLGPNGWNSTITVGQITRLSGENDFTAASGLDGDTSDWLISGSLETLGAYDIIGRVLLDDDFSVTKNELQVGYTADNLRVASTYAYLASADDADLVSAASEILIDTSYDFTEQLTGSANLRYDFNSNSATEAGLGLAYFNECVEVALSVSRNFTASDSVTPSTDVSLTVGLRGFGTGTNAARPAPRCR